MKEQINKKAEIEQMINGERILEHPQIQRFVKERNELKSSKWVPQYHYYAPYLPNSLNDPNGLCYWKGLYHLFYQQSPFGNKKICWGHIVSGDLVHWNDLPTAIIPENEKHCYSGGAYVDGERVLAIYHGVGIGNMIAEASDPMLLSFKKMNGGNPVIPIVPTDEEGKPYRVFDPYLWKEENTYYALSGSFVGEGRKKIDGEHRMALYIFSSQNLIDWTFLGEMMPNNPFYGMGDDAACPYFLPIGNKYMLLHFSHTSGPHCLIGDYDKQKHIFSPTQHYPLAHGEIPCGGLHAPSAINDTEGGCYVVFNMKDADRDLIRKDAMSIFRHFYLGTDGRLRMEPIKQLKSLRTVCENYSTYLNDRKTFEMNNVGNCYELNMHIDMLQARALRISVLCDTDGREHTDVCVTYRKEDEQTTNSYPYIEKGTARTYLTIDSLESSLSTNLWPRAAETVDTVLPISEQLHLRIFVDCCIVEVFLNDRLALSQFVYPTLADSIHASITAIGGNIHLINADVWQLKTIYD